MKLRNVTLLGLLLTVTVLANGQSVQRASSTQLDSGQLSVTGGAGGKNRIKMRVWVDETQHSDGTYTFALNYDLIAEDRGTWGWSSTNQLYNLTWTFTYKTQSGVQVSKSGSIGLDHIVSSRNVLFDGTDHVPITVLSVSVTGQRYGGSNGIKVSYSH